MIRRSWAWAMAMSVAVTACGTPHHGHHGHTYWKSEDQTDAVMRAARAGARAAYQTQTNYGDYGLSKIRNLPPISLPAPPPGLPRRP